jgi:hypothetical protein
MFPAKVDKLVLLAGVPTAQFRNVDLRQKMASSYVYFFSCPWLPARVLAMDDYRAFEGMFSKSRFMLKRRCASTPSVATLIEFHILSLLSHHVLSCSRLRQVAHACSV